MLGEVALVVEEYLLLYAAHLFKVLVLGKLAHGSRHAAYIVVLAQTVDEAQ